MPAGYEYGGVIVILNTFSRPQNTGAIVNAWKTQSIVPNRIVLVDNNAKPPGVEHYPSVPMSSVDDVWRWTTNSGCPCHFYPALAYTKYKYTVFADDDLIPGSGGLELLLRSAAFLKDRFATLGQIGRVFMLSNGEGMRYNSRNTPQKDETKPVLTDLTCRAHMVLSRNLPSVFSFRNEVAELGEDAERLSHIHDDFLLCMGIQRSINQPSYILPFRKNPEDRLIKTDLDDNRAVWRSPTHWEDRNKMVDISIELGWNRVEPVTA